MQVSILYHDPAVHYNGSFLSYIAPEAIPLDARNATCPHHTMSSLRIRFRQWKEARRLRQITPAQARQRVARGAAYLDEVDPGWYQQIDPTTLELSEGRCCVLGQLHGDFRLGLGRASILDLSSAPRANLSPVALGFLCVQEVAERHQAQDYRNLDEAWQDAIDQRCQAQLLTEVLGEVRAAGYHPQRPH